VSCWSMFNWVYTTLIMSQCYFFFCYHRSKREPDRVLWLPAWPGPTDSNGIHRWSPKIS
jgi:hypothetical protein